MNRGSAHPRTSGVPARGRLGAAVLLVVLGAAAIVYAAALHVVPVFVEQAKPAAPPAPAVEEGSAPAPQAAPAKELVASAESEPSLVREVTVGGVVRTPSGEIKRTYSGQAPALCPT
jgi:hypothetical protein